SQEHVSLLLLLSWLHRASEATAHEWMTLQCNEVPNEVLDVFPTVPELSVEQLRTVQLPLHVAWRHAEDATQWLAQELESAKTEGPTFLFDADFHPQL